MSDAVTRLNAALEGRYVVEHQLGEGGMATVYLAHDERHDRHVAIKVLKPELAAVLGADRFLTEIKTTANLQHPHILPLYDSGEADGFLFYVMPYIEGESLRDRLDRETQLPVDEAVRITRGVAAALQFAHEHDVIHRDIKPENILIQAGEPVVADFGIALAVSAAGGGRLTETGLSLGTPHYMSPEQATADKDLTGRSDIYGLASVLYEMLAGDPPHTAPTAQAILMKILTDAPAPVREHRKAVPTNVEAAIARALEKLPADRFDSAEAFARALDDEGYAYTTATTSPGLPSATRPPASVRGPEGRWRAVAAVSGAAVVVLAALLWSVAARAPDATRGGVVALPVAMPDSLRLLHYQLGWARYEGSDFLITTSPRGLIGRDLSTLRLRTLFEGDGSVMEAPFASPSDDWVGFHINDGRGPRIVRTHFESGATQPLVSDGIGTLMGAAWSARDEIVYAPGLSEGLWQTSVDGAAAAQLTFPDTTRGELGHWRPHFLPDGEAVLFTSYRPGGPSIHVLDLRSSVLKEVVPRGADARYVPSGHLIFAIGETLYAAPFDLENYTAGPAEPVVNDVYYSAVNAISAYAVSQDGTLAYVSRPSWTSDNQLVWVERDGSETPLREEWARYTEPRISPDEQSVAYGLDTDGDSDVWVYDVGAADDRPLSRDDRLATRPVWAGDGSRILYAFEEAAYAIYERQRDGDGERRVLGGAGDYLPWDVSRDGEVLALVHQGAGTGTDIWTLRLGDAEPIPFRATDAWENAPAFSPDGRWLAYTSNETGRYEIWIERFPEGERLAATTAGGAGPVWGADGELFYHDEDRMMSVRIDLATGAPGARTELFRRPYSLDPDAGGARNYDVQRDGLRFLIAKPRSNERGREVVVVLDWLEDLRRRVPVPDR